MNRRNFLKGCIVSTGAVYVPISVFSPMSYWDDWNWVERDMYGEIGYGLAVKKDGKYYRMGYLLGSRSEIPIARIYLTEWANNLGSQLSQ